MQRNDETARHNEAARKYLRMGVSTLSLMMICGVSQSWAAPTSWSKLYSPQIADRVERNEPVEVLVLLDDSAEEVAERQENARAPKLFQAKGADYRQRLEKRKNRMRSLKQEVATAVADADLQVKSEYSVLPVMHLRLDSPRALAKLVGNKKILSIDENRANSAFLTQSLPLIGRNNTQIASAGGAGTTVAVLDTGVDYTRSAFGGCNAPGGACKVVYAQDFAATDNALDDHGHGTNVAGVVLGVAPQAKIAALDVFRSDGYAYSSDVINAINWCVTNKATYNIAAINMSLGGGKYTAPVNPIDSWGVAIQRAVDAGIVVVASAGNDGYTNAMGTPAAYSNVVSVGAVYDANQGGIGWGSCTDATTAADKVTCFSDSASFLTMLAPGAVITAGDIIMGGTSQASPHVAGAAAVLRGPFPSDSVSQLITRLKTGKTVTDARNGLSFPRLDLPSAIGSQSGFTLVANVSPAATGQIAPAGGVYNQGASVTLTATANTGYAFTGWSGACSGTATTCTVVMDANKTVAANFTATVTQLSNGVTVSSLSGAEDSLRHFAIDVPSGQSSFSVKTSGGTGDVDLYVRKDSLSTTEAYDCSPYVTGNNETCTFTAPVAGRYYVSLHGYAAYSGLSLLAQYASATAQTVQMQSLNYSVSEGGRYVKIPVTRQGGTTGKVSVKYATLANTAKATSDFTSKSGTLTWAAGDTSIKYISVTIVNNRVKESAETFSVQLSSPSGAVLGSNKAAVVTIIDND